MSLPEYFSQPNIGYELEKRFVLGLKRVLGFDPKFTYNANEALTKVMIASAYPQKDYSMKVPQIVVQVNNYSMENNTLFENYYDVIIESGKTVGYKWLMTVPYSVSLVCLASVDGIAKDLADTVGSYIKFGASSAFNDTLSLNTSNISVSQGGGQYRNMPRLAFAHTASVQGVLHWTGIKKNDPDELETIDKIHVLLQTDLSST